MSGGNSVRKAFDYPAIQDSRVIAEIGRGLNIPALTNEAKHNERNPGRAETKATINAALWYLGGEAGSALGGAGDAGAAAADGVNGYADAGTALDEANAASAASQAAGGTGGLFSGVGSQMTTDQLQQLALQNTANGGILGSGSNTISPLTQQQLMQLPPSPASSININPSGLSAPTSDLSVQATGQPLRTIQDYAARYYGGVRNLGSDGYNGARNLFGQTPGVPAEQASAPLYEQSVNAVRGSGSGARNLAMQMGLKMLTPQQRQPMPSGMPAPQGQQGPLTNPYQSNPYGPGGNSLGLSEDQKQKLRAMGYQIP